MHCYIGPIQDDLDLVFAYYRFAWNSSMHAMTGMTPSNIMYGQTTNIPVDHMLCTLNDSSLQYMDDMV